MFNKGEFIVYGNNGVCEVVDYMKPGETASQRTYYVLSPVRSKGSTIYSPVDNKKVLMRKIISKDEAKEIIDNIPSYEDIVIRESRTQEQQYKQILSNCDCVDSLRLIKALYERKKTRENAGRKITAVDEKYLFLAKDALLNELALALDIPTEEVDGILADQFKYIIEN